MNGEIIFLIQVLVQQVAFRDIFYQKKEVLSKKDIKLSHSILMRNLYKNELMS